MVGTHMLVESGGLTDTGDGDMGGDGGDGGDDDGGDDGGGDGAD